MSIRIVCKCPDRDLLANGALLAKVRGVADVEDWHHEGALDARWVADWHHRPNLDWQKGFKALPLADDATDEQRKVRAFLTENIRTLSWEVSCPRKDCSKTYRGHTEDLVVLVQRALADGVRNVALDPIVLHEISKETRTFTVTQTS